MGCEDFGVGLWTMAGRVKRVAVSRTIFEVDVFFVVAAVEGMIEKNIIPFRQSPSQRQDNIARHEAVQHSKN